MKAALLGLGLAALVLSACDGEPLLYEPAVGADALAGAPAPIARPDADAQEMTPPPPPAPEPPPAPPAAPVACDLRGLNFFEYACPGHPLCVRCRDEEPSGTGYLPLGCIAPSGGACVDFCEFCN